MNGSSAGVPGVRVTRERHNRASQRVKNEVDFLVDLVDFIYVDVYAALHCANRDQTVKASAVTLH